MTKKCSWQARLTLKTSLSRDVLLPPLLCVVWLVKVRVNNTLMQKGNKTERITKCPAKLKLMQQS